MPIGAPEDRAYLSILSWPEDAPEDRRVELLVSASGMDPYNSRLAVRRGTPAVVSMIDADIAGEVVAALRTNGVDAFAPARSEMEALPAVDHARRIGRPRGAPDRLALTLRGGGSVSFSPGEVRAVLRATLVASRSTVESKPGNAGLKMGLIVTGGLPGAVIASSMSGGGTKRTSRISTLEHLEIQLTGGRRYRLNSRTAPEAHADRLRSGKERLDELALKLGEMCPDAYVDTAFRRFHCPADVVQSASRVTGAKVVRTKDDAPRFEFYSAWTMLMLRECLA